MKIVDLCPNSFRRVARTLVRLLPVFLCAAVARGQEATSAELVRSALAGNAELAAARLEIEKARARLRQAGLRPNPALDFERQDGVRSSPGERSTSVGLTLPLELFGQRGRRLELARAELAAAEAEVADRERRLGGEVLAACAEALAARRELEVTEGLTALDVETARVVEARVAEGDAAPLELNLLRVEADRLQARRALVEGRMEAALLRLKQLAGVAPGEFLRLGEGLAAPGLQEPPASIEVAVRIALGARPDLRLARLAEEAAAAGYRLARAQAAPQVTAFTRYMDNTSTFDQTPVGVLTDRDRLLSFGVSVSLPVLNRNQGAQAEARAAVAQARLRREFAEAAVRSEVAAAYRRHEAARAALATYEQGVIARSQRNVQTVRAAYEAGAFRVTELLSEQRRLIDAQRELTEALSERYRALADLHMALGTDLRPRSER